MAEHSNSSKGARGTLVLEENQTTKLNTKPGSHLCFFWCYRAQFLHPFSVADLLLHGHRRPSPSGAAEGTNQTGPHAAHRMGIAPMYSKPSQLA